jgi:hypothetical protein
MRMPVVNSRELPPRKMFWYYGCNSFNLIDMDTLNTDYNSLSPEQKKVWVKEEMKRQRIKFRSVKYKGQIKK